MKFRTHTVGLTATILLLFGGLLLPSHMQAGMLPISSKQHNSPVPSPPSVRHSKTWQLNNRNKKPATRPTKRPDCTRLVARELHALRVTSQPAPAGKSFYRLLFDGSLVNRGHKGQATVLLTIRQRSTRGNFVLLRKQLKLQVKSGQQFFLGQNLLLHLQSRPFAGTSRSLPSFEMSVSNLQTQPGCRKTLSPIAILAANSFQRLLSAKPPRHPVLANFTTRHPAAGNKPHPKRLLPIQRTANQNRGSKPGKNTSIPGIVFPPPSSQPGQNTATVTAAKGRAATTGRSPFSHLPRQHSGLYAGRASHGLPSLFDRNNKKPAASNDTTASSGKKTPTGKRNGFHIATLAKPFGSKVIRLKKLHNPKQILSNQLPAIQQISGLPPVWLEIPCGGRRYQAHRNTAHVWGNGDQTELGTNWAYLLNLPEILSFPDRAAPTEIDICSAAGWSYYGYGVSPSLGLRDQSFGATLRSKGSYGSPRGVIKVIENADSVPLHDEYALIVGEPGPDQNVVHVELKTLLYFPSQHGMPEPLGYKAPNYRPFGDTYLSNIGILDPQMLDETNGAEGIVIVTGHKLDAQGISVTLNGDITGQILEHSPSRLKIHFSHVIPGSQLCLQRFNSAVCLPTRIAALAYRTLGHNFFVSLLQNISLILGNNQNNAEITAPGKQPVSFPLPPFRQNGFDVRINDIRSEAVKISLLRDGSSGAILRLIIPFESAGHEVTGTFLRHIQGWKCDNFRISGERCNGIDIPCFATVIGSALGHAVTCLDPGNWTSTSWNGPTIPVSLDMVNPSLQLDLKLTTRGGNIVANGTSATFSLGNLSGTVDGIDIPLGQIQSYFVTLINSRFAVALQELGLDKSVAEPLNSLIHRMLGNVQITSVTVDTQNKLFIDLQKY